MKEFDEESNDRSNDEIDFEPEDELGSTAALTAKNKKLREELEQVKAERQEYLDGWQRCKADMVNARKELLASAERTSERGREVLIESLIPVLDSFDMATASLSWESIEEGWRRGMEHVRNQLIEALERSGAKRYGQIGDMFDPRLHEVTQEEHDGAHKDGEIVRILRAGYTIGDRVLRPAHVIIFTPLHDADKS